MKKNYELKQYKFDTINSKIIIPKFQRSIEWELSKQKKFIKNVIDGNPFGCILVSEQNKNSEGKYYLIDGLQRFTALRLFKKSKYNFLDWEMLNSKKLMEIIQRSNKKFEQDNSYEGNIKKVEKLAKDFFNIIVKKRPITDVFQNDKNDYLLYNDEETIKVLKSVKSEFERYISITGLKIPTIVYKGNDLADVFVTLNTTAVTLTKYDVFAASWPDRLFLIDDEEITNKVISKYKELEKYDFDVEKQEEDITDGGITLFEYCYALGEIISSNHSVLFPPVKSTTNPCGFEILALICGITLGSEDEIKDYLVDASEDFLKELKKDICDSIDAVEKVLKDWIIAKNGKINISDRTYMIYHIIMSYIKMVYNITIDNDRKVYTIKKKAKNSYNEELAKFKKYLPYHYFLDSISGFWTLHRQVSDLTTQIENNSKKYFSKPSVKDINDAFAAYEKNTVDVFDQNVSFENRLIIDYLLKLKISVMDDEKKEIINELFSAERLAEKGKMIDFEHIISKKKFEHKFEGTIKELCKKYKIYSLGNLCYLDSKTNRAKGGFTVYEFHNQFDAFLGNIEENDYLSAINYPRESEIDFLDENEEIFIREYNQFINNREDEIIDELKVLINKKLKNKITN